MSVRTRWTSIRHPPLSGLSRASLPSCSKEPSVLPAGHLDRSSFSVCEHTQATSDCPRVHMPGRLPGSRACSFHHSEEDYLTNIRPSPSQEFLCLSAPIISPPPASGQAAKAFQMVSPLPSHTLTASMNNSRAYQLLKRFSRSYSKRSFRFS